MRLAELFGISLGVQNIAANLLMFAIEIWVGRQYIGLGTFVNGSASVSSSPRSMTPLQRFSARRRLCRSSCSGWRQRSSLPRWGLRSTRRADLGIAPYDALALELRDHTPVPYFGCRVFTDAVCALACWMLGGL